MKSSTFTSDSVSNESQRAPLVMAVNGGSSSVKFALFAAHDEKTFLQLWNGKIERIGLPDTSLTVKSASGENHTQRLESTPDHEAAVQVLADWLEEETVSGALTAIGHRVVHGGPKHWQPERITSELMEELRRISLFDPEHLPEEIQLMEMFHQRYPKLPQIACFDTAFHHDLPRVAQMLAIPRRYAARGVRRYGFHGLSYSGLLEELARLAGKEAAQGRVILAHLGNGASLAAVRDGRPMDTSMGFTPAAGFPMSTRSGDLDPGLMGYLARTENMSAQEFNTMINSQSGLLGISETSSDMRDLLDREKDDERAADAVALFCYQVRKWIGAFAAALGGVDTLVFSGGMGEQSSVVRARICEGLEFLGISLEPTLNEAHADVISPPSNRVCVRVIPTDEERMIAKYVGEVLRLNV